MRRDQRQSTTEERPEATVTLTVHEAPRRIVLVDPRGRRLERTIGFQSSLTSRTDREE
jgi:hypothetical protein